MSFKEAVGWLRVTMDYTGTDIVPEGVVIQQQI